VVQNPPFSLYCCVTHLYKCVVCHTARALSSFETEMRCAAKECRPIGRFLLRRLRIISLKVAISRDAMPARCLASRAHSVQLLLLPLSVSQQSASLPLLTALCLCCSQRPGARGAPRPPCNPLVCAMY
jgi:hypothetical protein